MSAGRASTFTQAALGSYPFTPNHDHLLHRPSCARSQTHESLNRACDIISFRFCIAKTISVTIIAKIDQLSKSAAQRRRWESTGAEPPPPDGHLPGIASSKILRSTREGALRTPGIKWLDEHGSSPLQNTIGGRETRKMNVYQAIRDAMG